MRPRDDSSTLVGPAGGSARGRRIAYLVGRYPQITHTFVLREVRELRRQGFEIDTFSIWRSQPEDLLSDVDREEFASTLALLPPSPSRFAIAHARAFVKAPRAYASLLGHALSLAPKEPRALALAVTWFAEAVVLWHELRRRGIRHIHVHLNGTAPAVALLACRFANTTDASGEPWSYSMTVHGSKEFYDVHREGLEAKTSGARFVVCISDYTRSQVMAFLDEDHWRKLHVVRCGVDPDRHALRTRAAEADGPMTVMTVGRLDRMKGFPILLDAVAEVRSRGVDARLLVVGDGPSREYLFDQAERLGIAGSIEWAGAVGQDRMPELYARADVFCLTSFAEGIPIVIMEAMATGLPVVASRITGIPEIVEDGRSGVLVRAGRADEVADALEALARDPEACRRMGREGRERIEAEYRLDRSATQLAALFAEQLTRTADAARD